MHVLLSTFQGQRFLPAQLASIVAQSSANWVLRWRDDGSTDDSVATMRRFGASLAPGRCLRSGRARGHLGITASFLDLLRTVPPGCCAAFADQDDIWLPHKLRSGEAALGTVAAGRPALYFARQVLIDGTGRELGLSPLAEAAPFPAALTQNLATGCTVMLNPAAVALVAGSDPPPDTLHDWWSYLLVSAADGVLLADPEPAVKYRQHGGNAVGAPYSPLWRALAALRRGPDAFMRLFRAHVQALLAAGETVSPTAWRQLEQLQAALEGGPPRRLVALIRSRGLRRRTTPETALFWVWFLFG